MPDVTVMPCDREREIYERGGWADGRLGQAYDLIDAVRREKHADDLKGVMDEIEATDVLLAKHRGASQ